MGHVVHHTIFVTGGIKERADRAHAKAVELDLRPTDLVMSHVNADYSFLIGPDGSKSGWPDSEAGDERREAFKAWCSDPKEKVYVHWVEVAYGPDFGKPEITDSSDTRQYEEDYPEEMMSTRFNPKSITNRERALARAFIRNSYELTEAEIDKMIEDELKGVDPDDMHEAQLESE